MGNSLMAPERSFVVPAGGRSHARTSHRARRRSGPLLSGPPRPFGPSRPAVRSDDAHRRTIHRHAPISNDGDAVGPSRAPMGHREAHLGPPWRSVGEPGTARPVRGAPSACNTGLPVPRRGSHRRHRPVRAGCLPRTPSCPDPVGGPHRSAPSVTGAGRRVYQGPTPPPARRARCGCPAPPGTAGSRPGARARRGPSPSCRR